jgi:tetratricopeptide repeat protein 21B
MPKSQILSACTFGMSGAVTDSRSSLPPAQDSELARKIGQVLMVVHDYQRAVDYYNKAIRNAPGDVQLQHELGAFLVRMQQWGPAEVCLQRCLDRTKDSSAGVESLQTDVDS